MLHVLKKNRKWSNQPMDVEGRMLSLPPSELQPLSEREKLRARPIIPQKKATSPHHQILGKKSSHLR